jgi:hypothetical protein
MPRRSGVRVALAVAVVVVPGVAAGLIVAFALHQADVQTSTWYVVALALLTVALFRLGKTALTDVEAPERPAHGRSHAAGEAPQLLAPIERRLAGAARERRLFVTGLQPMLLDLARERIRLHDDLDLDSLIAREPDSARHTLGDELWTWLTTKDYDGPAPTAREIERMISAIEAL